ncbi:threonine-phosphate decarboxylase CobD [Plasticicumulans sp.]|uniref:threonine-phosphate decarboxylase CobD n=2 Tax=Plasticicumulans sp. TaxID=2307179 RepID=UPI0039648550
MLLEHGGRLNAAAARYRIDRADWLDLSTGINPDGWPVPQLPAEVWQRLPEDDDALPIAVEQHYGRPGLPVAGSQAALATLPRLRAACRVGVIGPTYGEHAHAWQRAGHEVRTLTVGAVEAALGQLDVLVAVNPDNPTGRLLASSTLLGWHRRLAARGGWLLVDEAYMDAEPSESLLAVREQPGLIVLRSLGKFWGLAGVRAGFVFAEADLRAALAGLLGPWSVSGPARAVAVRALADTHWQDHARACLGHAARRFARLLTRHGLPPAGLTALFQWVPHPAAAELHEGLARRGVLVRHYAEPGGLRFGLPPDEAALRRLELALAGVRAERLGRR